MEKRTVSWLQRLYRLDRWAALIAGLALLLMMLLGAANVVTTAVLAKPIAGTYELTEMLMVASTFLALALAHADDAHVRVTLLVDRLGRRTRAGFDALAQLGTAVVFAAIAWFGWSAAIHSIGVGEFSSGALPVPIWPARLALGLGASLMTLQALAFMARDLEKLYRS